MQTARSAANNFILIDKFAEMRFYKFADVAELADALDSGSSESNFMWVQLPSSAPCENTPDFRGYFCVVWATGVEVGAVVNDSPVDCQSRE